MTSPSLGVKGKRRHHKHRHKTKKNVSSRLRKDAEKATQPPLITQKRLTNKSGFNLKGTVVTSSVCRDSRSIGRGVEKTKKGSTEFDLQCLLKAAKNKEVLEKIPSPSVGTSSGIDDPSNLVQPYSEENNFQTKHKRSKAYQFAPAKKEYEFNSRSSSENDLGIFGNVNHDPEDVKEIVKSSSNKHTDSESIYQGSHESESIKNHYSDQNISSDINLKCKPCLSYYQKFAVGTVEALVIEKKKQFPSLNYLSDIELDLNNIYSKTHNKTNFQDVPPLSTREIVLTHETACTPSLKVDKLGITSSKPESEHQFVAKTESESKLRENQLFKEKSVAAWVRAIPGRSLNENNQEFQDNRNLTSKCEVARTHTEREFLKNIKKDSTMFKTTHSNPLKIIDNSSNWNMDHIQSPIFSPHMPPHKPLQPVKSNEEVERENEATKFGHSSLPWNEPWQNNQLMGNNWGENHPKVLVNNLPVRKKQQSYCLQRPQHPWRSWGKESDENFQPSGRKLLPESPSCPSPSITFDLPAVKRSWFTQLDSTKRQLSSCKDKPSMWSQFPKLLRGDQEKFNCEPVPFNREKDTAPKTLSYIKFSPRKMF